MSDNPATADPRKPPRRPFQFRLRTLLIVSLAVAVALGAWKRWETILRNADREAVRQALEDGRLKTDPYAPDDPVR